VLHVWKTDDGGRVSHETKPVPGRKGTPGSAEELFALHAMSFDGRYAVNGGVSEGRIAKLNVWEVSGRSRPREMTFAEATALPVAVTSDGRYVAASMMAKQPGVGVFEVGSGRKVAYMNMDDPPDSLNFSPDDKHLAVGDYNGGALLWEWGSAEQKGLPRLGHKRSGDPVVFSAKGTYAASAGAEAVLWKRGEPAPVTLPRAPAPARPAPRSATQMSTAAGRESFKSVAFSADERFVAAGGKGEVVSVWETATGREVARLRHDSEVHDVAFDAAGEHLATLSDEGAVRVWRLTGGAPVEVARLPHENLITALDEIGFAAGGKYLLKTKVGGGVELWLWRPGDLLELSCGLVTAAEPTPEEWRDYLGEELANALLKDGHEHCPPK
jgi:WD40 repeat protein